MRGPAIMLQLVIALAFLGGLAMQIWGLPAMSVQAAAEEPGIAYLRVPSLVVAICFVICLQLMLLACSGLLLLATRGRHSRRPAALLVGVVIGTIVAAGALCLGLGLWVEASTGGWSPPAFGLCILAVLYLVAAALVGVSRGLRRRALGRRRSLPTGTRGSAARPAGGGSRSAADRA